MEIKIYTLSSTRDINNIRYVGKTKQKLSRRLSQQVLDAKNYKKKGIYTNHNYNWINKEIQDGYDIVILELDSVEFAPNEDWKWFEQYWICQMKIWGFNLTNLTDGGDGNQNQVFSKESIEKRASKIRGIPRDSETKKKISEGLKGIKRSDETKAKVKKAIRELQAKAVNQYDKNGIFIKSWECALDAAEVLNIDRSNINHCCNHHKNHKTAGGFIWRFEGDTSDLVSYTPNSVVQLDLNGNKIAIYKTAILAKEATGVGTASISNCCNYKIESVKGFIFRKYKDFMNTQSVPVEIRQA